MVDFAKLLKSASEASGFPEDTLASRARRSDILEAKAAMCHIASIMGASNREIARRYGYASADRLVMLGRHWAAEDPNFKRMVDLIIRKYSGL